MEEALNEIERISVEAEHVLRDFTTKNADSGNIDTAQSDGVVLNRLNVGGVVIIGREIWDYL